MRAPLGSRLILLVGLFGCTGPQSGVVPGTQSTTTGSSNKPNPRLADTSLVLNEAMADNDSVLRDESGEFDDWLELYNRTDTPVALDGWILDDGDEPWFLATDVVVEPYGTVLLWIDGQPDQGPLHAPFRLGTETLHLYGPNGVESDVMTVPLSESDLTYGRFPDGSAALSSSIYATPDAPNPVDPGLSRDPSDVLFPTDQVIRVDLTLSNVAVQTLMGDNQARVEASVTVLGTTLEQVELTIKGGYGSGREFHEKAAFRMNLDRFDPEGPIRGQEHLTLNNMVQDPSAVHETLTYRLMREAGIPAPRVAHVELYMNGQYRGLYLNVETPDDQFLKRHFADPTGNLYEGVYGADVTLGAMGDLDQDEQGIGDVSDGSEVVALAEFLALEPDESHWAEYQARFDVDRTLKMLAAEVIVQHWDGYFWYPNNYRIYHSPSDDRWTLLPWGTDQTFGYPGGDIHEADGRVAEFCMGIPSCRAEYDNALWEMADRLLTLDIEGLIISTHDRVFPLFEADPYREASPSDMTDEAMDTSGSAREYATDVLAELGVL
ncbi:MAG: hypothetical protein GWP91_03230 [Rhodobacterales bacterium]|nr:hypothetical protein [Rhodobacterales bacterium]